MFASDPDPVFLTDVLVPDPGFLLTVLEVFGFSQWSDLDPQLKILQGGGNYDVLFNTELFLELSFLINLFVFHFKSLTHKLTCCAPYL